MKYLKTYDKYNDSTDELVHLLYDGLLEDWEKKKDTADYLKRPNLKDVSINKVKKLLDKGADINANDPHNNYGSILGMALYRNDLNLVKF